MADTLFGDSSDLAKPRTPAQPNVVALLAKEGVSRETAAGYENRQAWAVLQKLRRERAEARDRAAAGGPSPELARAGERTGVSLPERAEAARVLEEVAADPESTADLLARVLEVSVYALSGGERRRACWGLARLLRGEGEGR